MSVQINTLEVENVKRVKAVKVECAGNALTVIGGRNGQGKTSVLDAISFALGGERFRPSNVRREESVADPEIRITLSNGLVVERKGKNSALKVIDPQGNRGGQKLLDSFIHQFALDLPKFLNSSAKEKANTLLQVIGVGEELARLELEEKRIYDERHAFGRIADQKRKFANELPHYDDAPETPVSARELIERQQGILARNGENQRKRQHAEWLERERIEADAALQRLKGELAKAEEHYRNVSDDLAIALKSANELQDESTAEIETSLREIDEINVKVRANLDKAKANEDAEQHDNQYTVLTQKIEQVRAQKAALLNGANLPLPGLTVEQGDLLYNGRQWDCMSGSDQLRVATAIVRKLNPECGFALLDKLEQMDTETLQEFSQWLEHEGLQVIATRVSTGDECSIIIEDGFVMRQQAPERSLQPAYTPGTF
ncbi:AAA family ATPase [Candidatus Sumerlaeota bacterium]|nr:AAA family ATPase [Candidatus Sumerlaeota bacterium]